METIKKYFLYADLGAIPVTGAFMYKNKSTYRTFTNAVISSIIILSFLIYASSLFYRLFTNPQFNLQYSLTESDYESETLDMDQLAVAYQTYYINGTVIPRETFDKYFSVNFI